MARVKAEIQPDIIDAFSLKELRTFRVPGSIIYAVVGHNPEAHLISDIWFGSFPGSDAFRVVLNFIRDCFETGDYHYWLADLRFMSSSFMKDHDWMLDELMPAIYRAGLVREAVVLPEPSFQMPEKLDTYTAANTVLNDLADGRVRGFHTVEKAKTWLLEGILTDV